MTGRIVVVDDESLVRLDFIEFLEENGYEVVGQASNGIEAIKVCGQTLPDVVLMDIEMPILDGFSATKQIMDKKLVKGGVVFLSAYSSERHIEQAKQLSAGGYLVKPLDEKSLIPTIEMTIAKGKSTHLLSKKVEQLEMKLEDRKIIEQAKGLLMKQEGMSESEAFKMIRDTSMKNRISMRKFSEILLTKIVVPKE